MMKKFQMFFGKGVKLIRSEDYNYNFNLVNGFFSRWGKTEDHDPEESPYGPEILDIEITEICGGIRCDLENENSRQICKFCYKSNTPDKTRGNMSFETFKIILDKINARMINGKLTGWPILTQVAFGADAQAKSNPDLWKMMDYCRTNPYNMVIPNITVADIDDETADKLVKYCGAVAVSYYPMQNKECCYQSIKKLLARGMKQVNVHAMVSSETYQDTCNLFSDIANDSELFKLNAVVMLSLKQKGRGVNYHPMTRQQLDDLYRMAIKLKVGVGFDSCSARKFLECIEHDDNYEQLKIMVDPCESTKFSSYINYNGEFYPCSFMEGVKSSHCGDWEEGLDVIHCNDFLNDIWFHKKTKVFRDQLTKTGEGHICRGCPEFNV